MVNVYNQCLELVLYVFNECNISNQYSEFYAKLVMFFLILFAFVIIFISFYICCVGLFERLFRRKFLYFFDTGKCFVSSISPTKPYKYYLGGLFCSKVIRVKSFVFDYSLYKYLLKNNIVLVKL